LRSCFEGKQKKSKNKINTEICYIEKILSLYLSEHFVVVGLLYNYNLILELGIGQFFLMESDDESKF